MPPGGLSSIAAGAAACTAARFVVRELPGRGRGLVAVGDVASGEQLAAFAAYSHNCDTRASECAATSQCCATCLRWGVGLPERCSGCPAAYCSPECRAAADLRGHQLCCAALQRIHTMRPKPKPKFSKEECSTACFLLRAFAQRASERQRAAKAKAEAEGKGGSEGVVEGEGEGGGEGEGECGGEGEGGGEPSFEDAMAQEEETEHTAKELSSQAQTPYSNPNRKPDPDPNLNPNPNQVGLAALLDDCSRMANPNAEAHEEVEAAKTELHDMHAVCITRLEAAMGAGRAVRVAHGSWDRGQLSATELLAATTALANFPMETAAGAALLAQAS